MGVNLPAQMRSAENKAATEDCMARDPGETTPGLHVTYHISPTSGLSVL